MDQARPRGIAGSSGVPFAEARRHNLASNLPNSPLSDRSRRRRAGPWECPPYNRWTYNHVESSASQLADQWDAAIVCSCNGGRDGEMAAKVVAVANLKGGV